MLTIALASYNILPDWEPETYWYIAAIETMIEALLVRAIA